MAEDETRYPEYKHFGIQPAFGIHVRHIENLEVKSVKFHLTGEDARPVYKYDDVDLSELEYPLLVE